MSSISNPKLPSRGVLDFTVAELKRLQTFEIILPNLIHKSKKRNLK